MSHRSWGGWSGGEGELRKTDAAERMLCSSLCTYQLRGSSKVVSHLWCAEHQFPIQKTGPRPALLSLVVMTSGHTADTGA